MSREGFRALYRGCAMPLLALTTKRPVEFAVFEACNKAAWGGPGGKGDGVGSSIVGGPFFGGALAGVVSATLGCPFNVVKVQTQSTSRVDGGYKNALEAAKTVWRARGFFGFYRGLKATLIMQVPGCACYLGFYGTLREWLPQRTWTPAAAGCLSSMAMWTVLLPLDTVRTLTQAHSFKPLGGAGGGSGSALSVSSPLAPPGWLETLRNVVRERGVRGLWSGWVPIAWRAIPVSAASMLAYEQTRELLRLK